MSVLSERPKDCLGCKLISGFGLMGTGMYVMSNARRFDGYQKGFMMSLASGMCFLGIARLMNFPVFPMKENKTEE